MGSAAIIDQTFSDGGTHCSGSRSYPGPSKNSILSSFSASRHCSSFNSVCTSWDSKLYHFCPFDGASFIAIRPKYTEQARRSLNTHPTNTNMNIDCDFQFLLLCDASHDVLPLIRCTSLLSHIHTFHCQCRDRTTQLLLYYCAQEIGNVHQNFWARRIVDVA